MTARIVYLATADARGHLMRGQLLTHALRQAGAQVQMLTTSDAGQRFLQDFGITSTVLSRHYAVQFDEQQNMLRAATNRNVAAYLFHPAKMLRDLAWLRPLISKADLVIDDSFHPALLLAGTLPRWRRKIVHVHGATLKQALLANFDGAAFAYFSRVFQRIVRWQIETAYARIEHEFSSPIAQSDSPLTYKLPTPIALASTSAPVPNTDVAVYLNPHFRAPALAHALRTGIADAGLTAHCVAEGYADLDGWHATDTNWVNRAAHARWIVSAPSMAALSVAAVYERPIILVVTDQPEQAANAQHAARLGLAHRIIIWRGDERDFRLQMMRAIAALPRGDDKVSQGIQRAQARLDAWTQRLLALAETGNAQ